MQTLPNLTLKYKSLVIGTISDVYCSDWTFYGSFKPAQSTDDDDFKRVSEFICFCVDWHQRLDNDADDGPDPDEFNRFSIVDSKQWTVTDETGTKAVADAPVFFPGREITWRLAGT